MSRFYEMDLEVKKAKIDDEEFRKIKRIFEEEWGYDPNADVIQNNGGSAMAVFGCDGTLCGGVSEEEAHEHIRDAIKREIGECTVKTRWTYLEELPYEEYID
jgi:hypothetical protein